MIAFFLANSADPDEMVHFVDYNLGLHCLTKEQFMLALLYEIRVFIQIFTLVGGTSLEDESPYKREYVYIYEYLYNKTLNIFGENLNLKHFLREASYTC